MTNIGFGRGPSGLPMLPSEVRAVATDEEANALIAQGWVILAVRETGYVMAAVLELAPAIGIAGSAIPSPAEAARAAAVLAAAQSGMPVPGTPEFRQAIRDAKEGQ